MKYKLNIVRRFYFDQVSSTNSSYYINSNDYNQLLYEID